MIMIYYNQKEGRVRKEDKEMMYNILKIDEEARKTWLGETLERIVYTDYEEKVKAKVKEMNKEAGYKKYYAIRIEKDWRGRNVETPVED